MVVKNGSQISCLRWKIPWCHFCHLRWKGASPTERGLATKGTPTPSSFFPTWVLRRLRKWEMVFICLMTSLVWSFNLSSVTFQWDQLKRRKPMPDWGRISYQVERPLQCSDALGNKWRSWIQWWRVWNKPSWVVFCSARGGSRCGFWNHSWRVFSWNRSGPASNTFEDSNIQILTATLSTIWSRRMSVWVAQALWSNHMNQISEADLRGTVESQIWTISTRVHPSGRKAPLPWFTLVKIVNTRLSHGLCWTDRGW